MATQNLSHANDDGTILGQDSTDKIAFYGGTPADRPAVASAVTLATTVAVSASTGTAKWGYSTSTQANAVVTAVNGIVTDLEELGLIG